jgi:hypothetical protein
LHKGARARDEDVHLEQGLAMEDVEAGIALDGLGNHLIVNVEFVLQCRNKRLEVFQPHFCDNICILRGAHHAVEDTGERAAYQIGNAKLLEDARHFERNFHGFILH